MRLKDHSYTASPDHPAGQQTEADPHGTPAVHIFKQGTAITYGYRAATHSMDVEIQAAVLPQY
jgi:hypothetical protein